MNRFINILLVLPFLSISITTTSVQADTRIVPRASSIHFAVIGDYGHEGQPELDVANRVKSWNPDFIISLGDNNYNLGSASTIDANIGQYYHDYIFPYGGSYGTGSAVNRFFPVLGNHDWLAVNAQPYLDYFSLPGNERYYDFIQGPVHFFVLDSDPNEPDGISQTSVQAVWLRNALSASSAAWNVVLLHHPPFSSAQHGSTTILQWPYESWGADAVLAGHDHTYERIIRGGIPYFVNGLGGRSIYNFDVPVAGSQLRYNSDYGAMLVDATSTDINFQFITHTGAVVDQYALTKDVSSAIPLDPSRLSFHEVAGGLAKPVFVANAGDGSGRIFIIEQQGRIRIIKNGSLLAAPFLDIQSIIKSNGSEQGLLALAFDPSYSSNGNFYVVYTAPRNDGDTIGSNLILKKYTVSANNPDAANPASGVVLLSIDHPTFGNHNGGTLAFGQDGYLYWSTGDGGGGGGPTVNPQNLTSYLGKILRIDVSAGSPYIIPASNPFYSSADPNVKKEIWAYGFRNPWRFSFDSLTHDLYIGDVGQSLREEVDFQPANSIGGENYGWRVMEGSLCYNPSVGCDQSGKVLPVAEYDHTLGCSITGGYVYRGTKFPSLLGHYFYGDYCSGRLYSLHNDLLAGWQSVQLLDTPYTISTFGEDEQKELYLADYAAGKIYNIIYQDVPVVLSIVSASSNPTNAASVDFTITFSEPVTGVDASDFTLTTTGGVLGAAVSGFSGSGSVYTVSVNTGSGNGTIRLDVVDDNTILDATSNPLGGAAVGDGNFTAGEVYTVGKNIPPHDFGNQLFRTFNTPATISISNTHASTIHIGNLVASSSVGTSWNTAQSFFIEEDSCSGATVAPAASCTFKVRFLPWSLGAKAGTIIVPSDAPDQPYVVFLFGNSVPGTQLLSNRSFDSYSAGGNIPLNWQGNTNIKAGLDGPDTSWSFHGPRSFKLVGDGDLKILSQAINKSGVPGDDFSFNIMTRGVNILNDSNRWLLQITFYNGGTMVENRNIPLTTGTFNNMRLTRTYTATTNYTSIMFRIHYSKSSGTAWIDLASLQWAP